MDNSTRRAIERCIVRQLIRHLQGAGFIPFRVNDGDSFKYTRTEAAALRAVFAVDDASLRFIPAALKGAGIEDRKDAEHGVLLIGGNCEDIISDWNYDEGDADGFSKAMQAFDVEKVLAAALGDQ